MRIFESRYKKKHKLNPSALVKTLLTALRPPTAEAPTPSDITAAHDPRGWKNQVNSCTSNQPLRPDESLARQRHLQVSNLNPTPQEKNLTPVAEPDPSIQEEPKGDTAPATISPAMFKNYKAKPLAFTPPQHLQNSFKPETFDDSKCDWNNLTFSGKARACLERLSMTPQDIIDALHNGDMYEDFIMVDTTRFSFPDRRLYCHIITKPGIVKDIFSEEEYNEVQREKSPLKNEPKRGLPRYSGTKYSPKRKAPTTMKEFEKRVAEFGFIVESIGGNHRRLTHPEHPDKFVSIPSTPSETHRVWHNLCTKIRAIFQIDIRDYPEKK